MSASEQTEIKAGQASQGADLSLTGRGSEVLALRSGEQGSQTEDAQHLGQQPLGLGSAALWLVEHATI